MKLNANETPTLTGEATSSFHAWANPCEELGMLRSKEPVDPKVPDDFDDLSNDNSLSSSKLVRALLVLESLHVLDDNRVCLKIAEHLTQRVGYRCAGFTASTRVAELMLLSASASKLADQLDREGLL